MTFLSFSREAKSLAHNIYEIQYDTSNRKAFHIDLALQDLVNCVAATKSKDSPLLDIFKRRTRAAKSASSCFYDISWLTDVDKFPEAVAHFKKISTNFQIMDSSIQQFIMSAVMSAVATAVAAIQTKHKDKMLSLREMI